MQRPLNMTSIKSFVAAIMLITSQTIHKCKNTKMQKYKLRAIKTNHYVKDESNICSKD